MKKVNFTPLLLIGMIGVLAIGVVKAETTITHYTGSNIEYRLNNKSEHFTGVGTITITDGTDTITILDRNLGAKKAGTGCEDPSGGTYCEGGDDTYGYHFQWGNNYGFDALNTSIKENAKSVTSDGAVWSGIYDNSGYYGTTFIKSYYSHGFDYWVDSTNSSSNHENLRGGGGDYSDEKNGFGKNNENRRGPCPKGFHVPSSGELQKLQSMLNADGKQTKDALRNKLLIPFAGLRSCTEASVLYMGNYAYLWSSSPSSASKEYSRQLYLYVDGVSMYNNNRAQGLSVRCFYDYYQPYSLTLSFDTLGADNIDPQELIGNSAGSKPENPIKDGYNFNYRYLSGTNDIAFDFENHHITGDSTLYAHWIPIEYTIAYNLNNGTNNPENLTEYTIESDEVILNEPTKDNHTFEGRYSDAEFINKVDSIPTGSTGDITLYAKWKENKKSSGGSSGGGGGIKKDNCPNGDLSPSYYDGKCGSDNSTGDVIQSPDIGINSSDESSKDGTGNQLDSSDKSSEGQTGNQEILSPSDSPSSAGQVSFTKEQNDAYSFAFKNGITTMDTIQKANLGGYIKRGHLAKMITNYAVNVLGKEIPSDIPASCISFNDEATARESEEIKDYAIKSCALGLMGIRMKNNEFLPNDYVTRAEFGAVISRVLWGDKYNLVHTKEKPRYTDHLNALKNEGIMTKIDNPKMLEKRGYVMIMIMRSTQ